MVGWVLGASDGSVSLTSLRVNSNPSLDCGIGLSRCR
jgi:hypothetical protein